MSITITTYSRESAELVSVEAYTREEVARMLHVSANTVRRATREGRWPSIRIANAVYMTGPHIADAVDEMTQVTAPIPETPPTLGVVLARPDAESIE